MSKIAKGRKIAGSITSDISRADKIRDVKETIKCNEALIHYYQLLLDDAPENHLSFQEYLRDIDVRAEVIKEERRRLIATFDKASNGEISDLQRSQIELQVKLKTLRSQLSPEQQAAHREKKVVRIKGKAKTLIQKIAALEQELRDENFDFEAPLQDDI